jgi:hypothetical protein
VAPDHADQASPDDDTVARIPVASTPVRSPDLDDTITSGSRPAVPPPAPVPPTAPPGPPPTGPLPTAVAPPPAPVAPRLRLPDGGVVEIEGGTVYVGRRPTLPRVPASGIPQLVAVDSAGREVSSTHLAISVVGGAVVVRDMLSTNGTVVKTPGVPARTLLRGESAVVTIGTTLDIGDGNVLEVLR